MASYEFDIHTHSIASGHGTCATMTDMAKAANAAGLKMLGISDHGPKTLGGGRISYFRSLAFAQPKRLGVRMLYGAEVNILDQEGKLDLDDEILESLDYVIASMHRPILNPEQQMRTPVLISRLWRILMLISSVIAMTKNSL